MEYYSDLRKKELLLFATSWMDLEGITLSEIKSDTDTNTVWSHLCVECKKQNKQNSVIDRENKQLVARGE